MLIFGWACFFKFPLVEVSFGICLEENSGQTLIAKEFPSTSCLEDVFSIFFLHMYLGRMLSSFFSEEISLQTFFVDCFSFFVC